LEKGGYYYMGVSAHWRKAIDRVAWSFRGPLSREAPKLTMIANFAVTYRCQGRCAHCNIWRADSGMDELNLGEIRDLFMENRELLGGVTHIQITGGEPFMREDLPEIVSTISGALPGCTYWIPTNGLEPNRIEESTERILRALGGKAIGVTVSLDGAPKTHDSLRGVEGSHTAAVETLKRLTELRHRHPGLRLSIGMTIGPENQAEISETYDITRSHDVGFSFRPVNISDIYYRKTTRPGGPIDPDELLPAVQRIGRDLIRRRGLLRSTPPLMYMQGAIDYVRNRGTRSLPCSAASRSFFLDPTGDVYPCIIMDAKLGNIREESLTEIWLSDRAEEIRGQINKGRCPGCWVECEAYRDIDRDRWGLAATALRGLINPSTAGIR
jgi:MoaA/NifB/PqqE/SkfB family radical SAM enzyme